MNSEMKRVLYLGPEEYVQEVSVSLGSGFEVLFFESAEDVDAIIPSIDVVFDASMKIEFNASRIGRAKELKLFITATTGSSHIDTECLERISVPLLTLKTEREFLKNITPAAEHSWLLLQACSRGFKSAVLDVDAGNWVRTDHPGKMLNGRTLGIVGCGRIGQWMARYAEAFGMQVFGYDPHLQDFPASIEKCESLETLLPKVDFLTLHVHLEETTEGLIGRKQILKMKKGAVIINSSRGQIIDEKALLEALKSGQISAVGLDVLSCEPEIEGDPLYEYSKTHNNVIITPHIGGFSPDALSTVLKHCCGRIERFF